MNCKSLLNEGMCLYFLGAVIEFDINWSVMDASSRAFLTMGGHVSVNRVGKDFIASKEYDII